MLYKVSLSIAMIIGLSRCATFDPSSENASVEAPPLVKPQIVDQGTAESVQASAHPVIIPQLPEAKPLPPTVILPLPLQLTHLEQIKPVPGGIAWVVLDSQSPASPSIIYQQQRVMVLQNQQQWVALVGIPLSATPGRHMLVDQATGQTYTFPVFDKRYKTQHLKLKTNRHVNPNPTDLQRIQQETKIIKAALASPWRATQTLPLPLLKPVQGRISSPFGLRRYFNGQPRKPHSGLDIAAPQGTPILAPATGIVVNTGDYFFNGKTIFIDHGQGLVTMYCHLHDFFVQKGESLIRGQTIGSVGKTGRATGPHLHWGVSLNQTMIDPMLVL